jgi:hypothetical protein
VRLDEICVMNESLSHLSILGVGLWVAGGLTLDQICDGAALPSLGPGQHEPAGASIEPRSRRRATSLTKAMADAHKAALDLAELDKSTIAAVFGSALGEVPTMLGLMEQMWRGEEMSPMRFATSVHSAASGVVSISSGNRGFTTSLSSDYDTVAASLLEAWGLIVTTGAPVVVVLGDDNAPAEFLDPEERFERLAVALVLGTVNASQKSLARIGLPARGMGTIPPIPVRETLARNPVVGALDLACSALARKTGRVRLDRDRGSGYCVDLVVS